MVKGRGCLICNKLLDKKLRCFQEVWQDGKNAQLATTPFPAMNYLPTDVLFSYILSLTEKEQISIH